MKLVSKDAAMATLTVVADEIRPLNGYYLPELFHLISKRYALTKVPSVDDAAKTGAKFQTGRVVAGTKEINIAELSIFSDGFNAVTTDTVDSDFVIDDLFGWLKQSLGFREPATKPIRTYQSDLVVDFDNDPSQAFRLFTPLMKLIQQELESATGFPADVQFNRFGLGSDPKLTRVATEFVFERRVGAPWTSKRYFCKAHMPTSAHIRALEQLDALFGSTV